MENWYFIKFTELVVQLFRACWLSNVYFMAKFSLRLAFIVNIPPGNEVEERRPVALTYLYCRHPGPHVPTCECLHPLV